MAVPSVDRTKVERSTDVDRWLALMNAAIDESGWKHKQEALATYMDIDKAYLSRLRSGDKPWRVEHVVSLPEDVQAIFARKSAEACGFVVVIPSARAHAARDFVAGLLGLLDGKAIA